LIAENLIIIIITWKHGGAVADVYAVHMYEKQAYMNEACAWPMIIMQGHGWQSFSFFFVCK